MDNYYSKEFVEVVDVLKHSESEITNKIPLKLYKFFQDNMDKDYKINIDYSNENWDAEISENAKCILALIYRDYLVSPEKRKLLIEEQKEEEKRIENNLREVFKEENIFNRTDVNNKEIELSNRNEAIGNENTAMVKYNETIFSKIKKWFKNLFV